MHLKTVSVLLYAWTNQMISVYQM